MRNMNISPDWVSRPLFIEGGEVTVDAVGHYCGESGVLHAVEVNGSVARVEAFRDWLEVMCANYLGDWARDITADEIEEAR